METVVVVIPVTEEDKIKFQEAAPLGTRFLYTSPAQVTDAQLKGADILIGNVPPARLAAAKNLKWMQLNSAGTDGYTTPGVLPEGCVLTNATGAYGLALAEHLLAMLLCQIKKLPMSLKDQEAHIWGDNGNVISIYGSTTLVVGLGDIGSEFAMRMHALGSRVIAIRRNKTEKPAYVDALYQMDALKDLLPQADFVATMLPGTPQTYHIFDADAFARMKPGAIFLNIGRGNAADSEALTAALNSGHLGGACLDVTEPEPLPMDHPLWDAKNVMITPHISGMYHLPETLRRIVGIAAENMKAYYAHTTMRSVVDFETGYRKL